MFTDGSVAATNYGDITLNESQQLLQVEGPQHMGFCDTWLKT
jgi:hypothetical protein